MEMEMETEMEIEMEMMHTPIRRAKWKYPPTPIIIHFPRRPCVRRKSSKALGSKMASQRERRGKMETLFDRETSFGRTAPAAVPIVVVGDRENGGTSAAAEEKWRVEAEMLRAECNLLRVEKEVAVKQRGMMKEKIERTLRSAIDTLLSVGDKISKGQNGSSVLEEEISHLVGKLQKLKIKSGAKDLEVKNCSNFDKQAYFLKRRLEKFDDMPGGEICPREIREMAEASLSTKPNHQVNESYGSDGDSNMEILRRKMKALSKGVLLERMEKEYESMISAANCSSGVSSASSSKHLEIPNMTMRQLYKETKAREEKVCSGRCKAIVRKLVEQVRAEAEQWSQMQEMLHQVREEMEELRSSRDYWEDRALDSDNQIHSLHSSVQEWREKALSSEKKVNDLHAEVSVLKEELEKLRKNLNSETKNKRNPSLQTSKEPKTETILGILVRRLKENSNASNNGGLKQKDPFSEGRRRTQWVGSSEVEAPRSPLREIGNISPAARQKRKSFNPKALQL